MESTTTPGAEIDEAGLRRDHIARFDELLPEYLDRTDWSEDRLRGERLRALRELLATAIAKSPWHRERLSGIDPSGFGEDDVASLPVMTKADLMANFDEIVTDRRLTLGGCERLLDAAATDSYLLGQYRAVASGGTSGARGVFVYGWDAWAICWASMVRFELRDWASDAALAGVERVAGVVAAGSSTHISAAMRRTFSSPQTREHSFPVSLPLDQIVAGLNELQPTVLVGYTTYLQRLAREAAEGRLRIAPRRIQAIAEPLMPEARAAIEEAWGVTVGNRYGMSEGVFAAHCGRHIHVPDDLCLFEPVDHGGRSVAPGVASHAVYVTNLYNHALPLIRYEVTDEVTLRAESCECGSAFRCIDDPLGRADDVFVYPGGVTVHPHIFRSALAAHRDIVEYQVIQTRHGADVGAVGAVDIDVDRVADELRRALAALRLPAPVVRVTRVPTISRQTSGKLRRFVPM